MNTFPPEQSTPGWDAYFHAITLVAASKSQDRSSKYGAVIVDSRHRIRSTGYNGIPRGITYEERYHSRPDKYMYFVHAEENAIFNAASIGANIEGCTMYVIKPPCVQCIRAIVQSGIVEVVYKFQHDEEEYMALGVQNLDNWRQTMEVAGEIAHAANVTIRRAVP